MCSVVDVSRCKKKGELRIEANRIDGERAGGEAHRPTGPSIVSNVGKASSPVRQTLEKAQAMNTFIPHRAHRGYRGTIRDLHGTTTVG